jgi:hypothetical protein
MLVFTTSLLSASERVVKSDARILVSMNRAAEALMPKEPPRPRLAEWNGVLGLGAYDPPGGSDWGLVSTPLCVLPKAGLGLSLRLDPITGRIP